ncbi:MAG TPA: HAD-IA family hydrolase [Syntrophaceticus sp.]|nr:HAD-IA family hydrolase [Syntrophaceticus sp.]
MLKTVLFDLDGTLIDSIPLIKASFIHTFNQLGIPWGNGEVLGTIGLPLRDVAKHYAPGNEERFLDVYAKYQQDVQQEMLHPFPGAIDSLIHIRKKGYLTGVVTSKRRKPTRESLNITGLNDFLDVVVTVEDANQPKPHPDGLLNALKQLSVPPAEAVYIGDSIYDIMTGKNAGTSTIGVTWGIAAKKDLANQHPDFLVDSWEELITAIDKL